MKSKSKAEIALEKLLAGGSLNYTSNGGVLTDYVTFSDGSVLNIVKKQVVKI